MILTIKTFVRISFIILLSTYSFAQNKKTNLDSFPKYISETLNQLEGYYTYEYHYDLDIENFDINLLKSELDHVKNEMKWNPDICENRIKSEINEFNKWISYASTDLIELHNLLMTKLNDFHHIYTQDTKVLELRNNIRSILDAEIMTLYETTPLNKQFRDHYTNLVHTAARDSEVTILPWIQTIETEISDSITQIISETPLELSQPTNNQETSKQDSFNFDFEYDLYNLEQTVTFCLPSVTNPNITDYYYTQASNENFNQIKLMYKLCATLDISSGKTIKGKDIIESLSNFGTGLDSYRSKRYQRSEKAVVLSYTSPCLDYYALENTILSYEQGELEF